MIRYALLSVTLMLGAEGSPCLKSYFLQRHRANHATEAVRVDRTELDLIAEQIWYNECGGRRQALVHWNEGEEFPSLGIGHFIWYSQGAKGPFCETFPELIAFFEEMGVAVPGWIRNQNCAPWSTRDEFLADEKRREELLSFLEQTRTLQAEFMAKRLERALPRIVASLPADEQLHVLSRFHQVRSEPMGTYALLDYLNFKGEGISPSERYSGQGWGLLQVLQMMHPGGGLSDFARCAKEVLRMRVANAPAERHEERWLPGWENRVTTYTNSQGQ